MSLQTKRVGAHLCEQLLSFGSNLQHFMSHKEVKKIFFILVAGTLWNALALCTLCRCEALNVRSCNNFTPVKLGVLMVHA